MENNNNNSHDQECVHMLRIDGNPLNSKSLKAALLQTNPHTLVESCLEEIAAGIKLNTLDLPFWAAAFEILRTSISTQFDESDQQVYKRLMESAQVYTYKTKPQNKEGDSDE